MKERRKIGPIVDPGLDMADPALTWHISLPRPPPTSGRPSSFTPLKATQNISDSLKISLRITSSDYILAIVDTLPCLPAMHQNQHWSGLLNQQYSNSARRVILPSSPRTCFAKFTKNELAKFTGNYLANNFLKYLGCRHSRPPQAINRSARRNPTSLWLMLRLTFTETNFIKMDFFEITNLFIVLHHLTLAGPWYFSK